MDMEINSAKIKQLRCEHMWSQEQLATLSNLSLRTIQRIESSNTASMESIKALAAVFEVSTSELKTITTPFTPYQHRQWGVVPLCIFLCIIVFLSADIFASSEIHAATGFALATSIACCFIFSSMTIIVTDNAISWHFTGGILKKTLLLKDISSYRNVRNPIWMGFGIRAFGTGWLYNVSGLLGIEIAMKSGAYVRLGSDEPNYLLDALERAMHIN